MKCNLCKLCLNVVRLDNNNISSIYWFCDLCYNVYILDHGVKVLITDTGIKEIVKNKYFELRIQND